MTGRIKSLDVENGSGFITAESGSIVGFCASEVMAYDVPRLAVGLAVSFDVNDDRRPQASNVCVLWVPPAEKGTGKHDRATNLRYLGFEHRGRIRAYLFESAEPGTGRRMFTVSADLALFARHHVAMQEGPALCLNLLADELEMAHTRPPAALAYSLSDREMLAFLGSRPVPKIRRGPRRTPAASGAAGAH